MQQATQSASSSNPREFAGILAALSASAGKNVPAWNDEELKDDVTTLSYERALQSHARSPRTADEDRVGGIEAPVVAERADCTGAVRKSSAAPKPEAVGQTKERFERNLKRASVTVRLSEAERAQLEKRACEAGLTVSAYLRSCTFEAEALRAQVKEALAELRTGPRPMANAVQKMQRTGPERPRLRRVLRPFLFWHRAQREVEG
jgi:hypothetical protein